LTRVVAGAQDCWHTKVDIETLVIAIQYSLIQHPPPPLKLIIVIYNSRAQSHCS